MKTPFFWYPENRRGAWLGALLSPLSYAFAAGTLWRRATSKPYKARVPVICIGNVVAGGAGKTPTALAVARLLMAHGEKPVFVTRGYGGSGETVCVDLTRHTMSDVGDEALLLAAVAPTWAGADRVEAIREAESYGTFIIMDDGLQNPTVAPTASLLVVDGEAGIGNGHLIPAGPLRESFASALKRVSGLVIIGRDKHHLSKQNKHIKQVPVFHAHLRPALPAAFPRKGKFVAFAGIGRPEKFYATAREMGLKLVDTFDFPDHHAFTPEDLDGLRLRAEELGARLLTTEKDAARLPSDIRADMVVLPVTLAFDAADAEDRLMRLFIGLE